MKKYICFDVGGTKVKHGLLLEDGTILSQGSYSTPCKDLDLFINNIVNTSNQYLKNNDVKGMAISLPGFINPSTGYSEQAGSVSALTNQNLKKLLEAKIPLQVEIENDGNCAALAEKMSGNAVNSTDFICITIGTGIGGGIFVNGKLLRGQSFRGGEFGFMLTQTNGKNPGLTLHSIASTSSLIKTYKRIKGINEYKYVKGETVFLEALKSSTVKALVDKWSRNISYGIFNLASTLNPQKILIGGGVSYQQELLPIIKKHLNEIPWWKELKVPVEICKHKNNAGMIGALYHFIQQQNTRMD